MKWDPSSRLSHKLSSILRHGNDGFKDVLEKQNGWVELAVLLQRSNFCQQHNVTKEQIETVVKNCPKQRFKISDDGFRIKATQGHTINFVDETLRKMTVEQAAGYDAIAHGTYRKSINLIMNSGLSRMARQHIHLTASDRVDKSIGVISGFRMSCEILIYVDAVAAIQDGIDFFVSENNVILCSGNDEGLLIPKYFKKVVDRQKGGKKICEERLAVWRGEAQIESETSTTITKEVSAKNSDEKKSSSAKVPAEKTPERKKLENLAKNLRKKLRRIEVLKGQAMECIELNEEQKTKLASEADVKTKLEETLKALRETK